MLTQSKEHFRFNALCENDFHCHYYVLDIMIGTIVCDLFQWVQMTSMFIGNFVLFFY